MAKKYYWLKLQKDFFKRHDIRVIEEMDNGKEYIIFYLKLLVESISHEGRLRFSETIPYNDNMLSVITNTNIDILKSAITVFSELGMMELLPDGTIYLSEVSKLTGSGNTNSTDRVQRYRARQLLTGDVKIPNVDKYADNSRFGGNYYVALERDGVKCRICGTNEKLLIHHIIAFDNNDANTKLLENLLTLCSGCHCTLHKNKPQALMPDDKLLESIGFNETLSKRYETVYKSKSIELEKEIDKEKEKKRTNFKKPTIEEIKNYCKERNNDIDANNFYDFYSSKGWKVGKASMKDWKACVRTWERRNGKKPKVKIKYSEEI